MNQRSKKMAKFYREQRVPFVIQFLADNPVCLFRLPDRCTGESTTVDEKINRSQGGALVPGRKADEQGQVFHPVCESCHSYKTFHPAWAQEMGWSKSNK